MVKALITVVLKAIDVLWVKVAAVVPLFVVLVMVGGSNGGYIKELL